MQVVGNGCGSRTVLGGAGQLQCVDAGLPLRRIERRAQYKIVFGRAERVQRNAIGADARRTQVDGPAVAVVVARLGVDAVDLELEFTVADDRWRVVPLQHDAPVNVAGRGAGAQPVFVIARRSFVPGIQRTVLQRRALRVQPAAGQRMPD